jgi:hypothetical protein
MALGMKVGGRKVREKLEDALSRVEFVRIVRAIRGSDRLEGFVVGLGREWLLLHLLNPAMFLDAYTALRVGDIKKIEFLGDSFAARALKSFNDEPTKPDRVRLVSAKAIASSAAKSFPLITLHMEERDPSTCYIGIPARASVSAIALREIDPEAIWHNEVTTWSVDEITRVEFDGRYERALVAVGSLPT